MSANAGRSGGAEAAASGASVVLLTLAAGQFLMTLDTSVMNVASATVAEDVGTDVTGIQTAITLYTLVMATLMITGGKIGALVGRKRAFAIGCVIYGAGGRPRAHGLVMAAGAVAVAVGPLIGGLFTTYLSWRLVFAGEVLIVVAILVLMRRIEDEPPGARPRID